MRILCGSGRGGTTWVLDCLADANGLRPIFEPLHPAVTPLGTDYAYRSLDPREAHPALETYFSMLHRGRYRSLWTDYRVRKDLLLGNLRELRDVDGLKRRVKRLRKAMSNRAALRPRRQRHPTLIKLIRGNLMIDWLCHRLDARVLLQVRHPAAVVESQLRLGTMWDPSEVLARYRRDTHLIARLGRECAALLEERLSPAAALALRWCIENVGPVQGASGERYSVVFYELLRDGGETEWRRAAKALDLANVPDAGTVARPSEKAAAKRSAVAEGRLRPYWLDRLQRAQIDDIARVLERCGCEFYRIDSVMPTFTVKSVGTISA